MDLAIALGGVGGVSRRGCGVVKIFVRFVHTLSNLSQSSKRLLKNQNRSRKIKLRVISFDH